MSGVTVLTIWHQIIWIFKQVLQRVDYPVRYHKMADYSEQYYNTVHTVQGRRTVCNTCSKIQIISCQIVLIYVLLFFCCGLRSFPSRRRFIFSRLQKFSYIQGSVQPQNEFRHRQKISFPSYDIFLFSVLFQVLLKATIKNLSVNLSYNLNSSFVQ